MARTVLRGGFGVFRYHDTLQPYDGMLDLGHGRSLLQSVRPAPVRDTPAGFEGLGAGDIVFGGTAIDVRDTSSPSTYSWSATINQRLPWSMNLEAGYVGNTSKDLINAGAANYNAVPLGGGERPLPQYGDFQIYRHSSYQNYHAPPDAAQPTARTIQLHGRLHLLEGPRHSHGRLATQGNPAVSEYQFDQRANDLRRAVHGPHPRLAVSYSLQFPDVKSGGLKNAFGAGRSRGSRRTSAAAAADRRLEQLRAERDPCRRHGDHGGDHQRNS